jgi:hypothetical protein
VSWKPDLTRAPPEQSARTLTPELLLPGNPLPRRITPALCARPMTTRVVEEMLAAAARAFRQMPAHGRRAAPGDGVQGAHVARQHGPTMLVQVRCAVPPDHFGECEHAYEALQVGHQAVHRLLQAFEPGLGHMQVQFRGTQRLVPHHVLDRAQGDATLEKGVP